MDDQASNAAGDAQKKHLLSILTPAQNDLVEKRRACCEACRLSQGVTVLTVRCDACGCAGVSLVHGRCKLYKWPRRA